MILADERTVADSAAISKPCVIFFTQNAIVLESVETLLGQLAPGGAPAERVADAVVLQLGDGRNSARLSVTALDCGDAPGIVEQILTGAPKSALRFEISLASEDASADDTAEAILMSALADLSATYGGIAWDEAGCVYDPVELDLLGHRGGTRQATFRFAAAIAHGEPFEPIEVQVPGSDGATIDARLPDGLPDASAADGVVYLVESPHVPFYEASRIIAAALGDARANPERRPVYVAAAPLEPSELAALAPHATLAPQTFLEALDAQPPAEARPAIARREVALFSPLPLGAARAADILAGFVADRRTTAEMTGEVLVDAPLVASEEAAGADARVAVPVGEFRFPHVTLRVAQLDLTRAHEALRTLAAGWRRVAALLGEPARSITILELAYAEPIDDAEFSRADALLTALTARFAAATLALPVHGSGSPLGEDEILHLLASGRGLHSSWTAWVGTYLPSSTA